MRLQQFEKFGFNVYQNEASENMVTFENEYGNTYNIVNCEELDYIPEALTEHVQDQLSGFYN